MGGCLRDAFLLASPFPVPLPSPVALNPCRPWRSSHLWEASGDLTPTKTLPGKESLGWKGS